MIKIKSFPSFHERQNGLIIGASGHEKITNIVITDEYNPSQRQNNAPVVYLASVTLSRLNLVSSVSCLEILRKAQSSFLSPPRFPALV